MLEPLVAERRASDACRADHLLRGRQKVDGLVLLASTEQSGDPRASADDRRQSSAIAFVWTHVRQALQQVAAIGA